MSVKAPGFEVVMPRLGLTMTEATVTRWLQPEGSRVEKGAPLFELEYEKATLEIEAPASGWLRILVPVNQVVPILTPIAFLDERNEEALPAGPADNDPAQPLDVFHSQPASQPPAALRATPRARALARKAGLDVSAITGSGPREMVTAADIQKLIHSQAAVKASPVAKRVAQDLGIDLTQVSGSGPHGKIMRGDVERAAPLARPALSPDLAALSGLRSIIANRLSASWLERPQVTLTTEADATFLVALRKQLQEEWQVKISYNAILMKLVAKALAEHPAINARLTHNGIQQLDEINIGLAVDTPRGLLVPVIRAAAEKSVVAIHDEFTSLAQRAVQGRSQPDDLRDGTFTITNLGMYEIDAFTPIINPPECAILGIGRIVARPVGLNGQIVLREMMAISLSFDHRLVDGAPAARFLQRVKTLIERCFVVGF